MTDNYSRDPDDLHGDQIVAVLELHLRRNGNMSIAGSTGDPMAIPMLNRAIQTIRQAQQKRPTLILPHYDADWQNTREAWPQPRKTLAGTV